MDLRDAAAYHMLVLSEEGASKETQRHYLFFWNLIIDGFGALGFPLDPMAMDTNHVRQLLGWYRGQVDTDSARGGAIGVKTLAMRAKTFSKFLEREEIIPDDLLRKLRPPRVEKVLREPFSQTEVAAMWGACRESGTPVRDEAIFLALLDTGMRVGELAGLTLDKFRLDERRAIIGRVGKGRRERVVPLGDGTKRDGGRVIRALRLYLSERVPRGRETGRVFLSRDGLPMSAHGISDVVQRLGQTAGVVNPIAHRLRHTFCTQYLVMFPGDELGLRQIVGHLSHDVLADYVHLGHAIVASRAGRASLAESWLGTGSARSPVAPRSIGRAAAGAHAGYVTPTDAVRRTSSEEDADAPHDSNLGAEADAFNVIRAPRKADRYRNGT